MLDQLPAELLFLILLYTGHSQYFARLAQTNKSIRKNLTNRKDLTPNYWLNLYRRDFFWEKHDFSLKQNNEMIYKKALKNYKTNTENLSDDQRKLCFWILAGDLESIKKKEEQGAWNPEIDFMDISYRENLNPIQLACLHKRQDILEYFYKKYTEKNASILEHFYAQIKENIVSEKPKDNKGMTKFYWAVACNILSEVESTNDVKEINEVFPNGDTLLCSASEKGHLEIVKVLLQNKAEVDKPHANTRATPIILALKNRHIEIAKILFQWGANVNHTNHDGVTPLLLAAEIGCLDLVKALLQRGATVDAEYRENGATPLWIASQNGHIEMVESLLQVGAAVDKARTIDGVTSLSIASQKGHIRIAELLLRAGATVDKAQTDNGATPLLFAVLNKRIDIVRVLLQAGAEVDKALTTNNGTPLHAAAACGYLDIVEVLLQAGAAVNKARTNDNTTALLFAAQNGHLNVVKALLQKNADVNKAFSNGITPLLAASNNGHLEVIEVLLQKGAEVNLVAEWDGFTITALQAAARGGHFSIVKTLLKAGAVDKVNNHGQSALDIARMYDRKEIATFLRLWEINLQLDGKSLLEKIMGILVTPITTTQSAVTHFFSSLEKSFKIFSQIPDSSLSEENLIKFIMENKSFIPSEKYEFIFEVLLKIPKDFKTSLELETQQELSFKQRKLN